MKMQFHPFALSYEKYSDFVTVCPPNEYVVMEPVGLPSGLPAPFLYKCNNAVVMASGSQGLHTVYVANCSRVDGTMLDQNPYIIWFDHEKHITTGGFIDHGNWPGRTVAIGDDFLGAIEASGIAARYPYSERPPALKGMLKDLMIDSHNKAFWNAVKIIGK